MTELTPNKPGPEADTSGMPSPVAATVSRKGPLIAVIVLVVLVGGVSYLYIRHKHNAAQKYVAKSAVSVLLEAGESGDANTAKKAMCAADRNSHVFDQLESQGRVTAYTIDAASTKSKVGAVEATVTTAGHSATTIPFPVVDVGGGWQVCVSNLGLPLTFNGVTSSSGEASLCTKASDLPGAAASAYVYAAEAGLADIAQSCVYRASVPLAVTESLKGKTVYDDAAALRGDGPYTYSGHGTSVTVTVTLESDGHEHVTGVRVS